MGLEPMLLIILILMLIGVTAITPDRALDPHTAALGLASSVGTMLPAAFANGMFVGQHGS